MKDEYESSRPRSRRQLTAQIANAVDSVLEPHGVAVVINAAHQCMTTRGVRKPGVEMVTSCMRGFRENAETRREFLSLIAKPRFGWV